MHVYNMIKFRYPTSMKTVASDTSGTTSISSKAGNKKTSKGGVKDSKQGNILSFFKKI